RTGVALGLGPVAAPGLQGGPVQRVTTAPVGEAVQPALGQVVSRVRLDLDGDVLVPGLLALGRGVVVEVPLGRVREYLRARLGVGEDWLGNATLGRVGGVL